MVRSAPLVECGGRARVDSPPARPSALSVGLSTGCSLAPSTRPPSTRPQSAAFLCAPLWLLVSAGRLSEGCSTAAFGSRRVSGPSSSPASGPARQAVVSTDIIGSSHRIVPPPSPNGCHPTCRPYDPRYLVAAGQLRLRPAAPWGPLRSSVSRSCPDCPTLYSDYPIYPVSIALAIIREADKRPVRAGASAAVNVAFRTQGVGKAPRIPVKTLASRYHRQISLATPGGVC